MERLDASRTRSRGHHRGGLTADGGAQPHTPGQAAGGAEVTPFFYQNSGVSHTQKGPLRGGDRDRAKGSRNAKTRPATQGEHSLSQPQSPARMSTEWTETAYRNSFNGGAPLFLVYAEL